MSDEISSKFLSKGVMFRDILLLPPAAALEFVVECSDRNVRLLGFDGFRLLPEGQRQPIMEDCLNLSAEPFLHCTQAEGIGIAKLFIEERLAKEIFFEMVTED
jgi:hypothetical protein